MSSAGQTSPCAIDRDRDTSDIVLQRNRSALETTLDLPMRWNSDGSSRLPFRAPRTHPVNHVSMSFIVVDPNLNSFDFEV